MTMNPPLPSGVTTVSRNSRFQRKRAWLTKGKNDEKDRLVKRIRKPRRIHFKYRSPKIVVEAMGEKLVKLIDSDSPIRRIPLKKKKPFDLDAVKSSSFSSCLACISRSRGKASRWNVAKHHRGKLLNSDRAWRTVEAVERREKKRRREREEGFSLVCRSLAAEALDWSEWSSRWNNRNFPSSTQLLINTQVFDCIGWKERNAACSHSRLYYNSEVSGTISKEFKVRASPSQLPPQVSTPPEHRRLSPWSSRCRFPIGDFRSIQHYWNRNDERKNFLKEFKSVFRAVVLELREK